MNKIKIYIIAGVMLIFLGMAGTIKVLLDKYKKEKAEKEVYQNNANILLSKVQFYQTKDSLNTASVGMLELKLSEYERYRADDLKLIESLKVDKKHLENITTVQSKTIYELEGSVRDSIIYRDNIIVDTLRCIVIRNRWFDLQGCSDKLNQFTGTFENRDSLFIVNHVKQKRFLGFLWYHGKKKNRLEVLSENPNTFIEGIEYIEIRD